VSAVQINFLLPVRKLSFVGERKFSPSFRSIAQFERVPFPFESDTRCSFRVSNF